MNISEIQEIIAEIKELGGTPTIINMCVDEMRDLPILLSIERIEDTGMNIGIELFGLPVKVYSRVEWK